MPGNVSLGKMLLRALAGVATVALAGVITLNPLAQYVDDPRVFELDGNAAVNLGQGGDDWANSTATGSGLSKAVATSTPQNPPEEVPGWPFVIADPTGYTIFTQGGSKDTNDVSQWKYTSGSVPDKDEITNAYAAAYQVTTSAGGPQPQTWVYFGADRFANNGDSNIGFWFFQNNIHADNVNATSATAFSGTPCPANATNCNPGDLHRDGDIFIVSAFTQGGAIGTIQLYHWDHTAGLVLDDSQNAAQCNSAAPSQSLVCAIINTQATHAPWPYTTKTPDPVVNGVGGLNDFPHGTFFEGGLNLTGLFNQLGRPQPCFSSFLAETRSSQTTSAQLKDFVLGNFQLCSVEVSKTCSAGTVETAANGSNFVRYTFTGSISTNGAGAIFDPTIIDAFPTGATNTHLGSGSTPLSAPACTPVNGKCSALLSAPGGLSSGGTPAAYSGYFDVSAPLPADNSNPNKATATAAPFSGGPQTVTNNSQGGTATNNWGKFTENCSIAPTPGLSLDKGCVVNIVQSGGKLVLEVDAEIRVCNTVNQSAGGVQVKSINVTDNVFGTIATNLTLNAPTGTATANCKHYYPTQQPSSCASTDGRCAFTDTVSITSSAGANCNPNGGTGCPVDDFGNAVPAPAAKQATCRVCPLNACSTSSDTALPDPFGTLP